MGNLVENGEDAAYQHVLLSHKVLKMPLSQSLQNLGLCGKGLMSTNNFCILHKYRLQKQIWNTVESR